MKRRWVLLGTAVVLAVGTLTVILAIRSPGRVTIGAGCSPGQVSTLDGHSWTCTFDDEFDGIDLDRTKWKPQTSFVTGTPAYHACYLDDPRVIQVDDGALHLSARLVRDRHVCGTDLAPSNIIAGMVSTYHLFSQRYGRFEVRARIQNSPNSGGQQTLWLWPDDRTTTVNWPSTGEMDFAEFYSNYPHSVIPYLHYGTNDNAGPVDGLNTATCPADQGGWHTYDVLWTATAIEFYTDGHLCLKNTSGDAAFKRAYIVNLTQALGHGTNSPTSAAGLPLTLDVDYVHIWK